MLDAHRYDGLVGQFSSKQIPCVGVSIGIERVFAVLEGKFKRQAERVGASIREKNTQVLPILSLPPGNRQSVIKRKVSCDCSECTGEEDLAFRRTFVPSISGVGFVSRPASRHTHVCYCPHAAGVPHDKPWRVTYCVQVLVASPGKGMMLERSKLACELWNADIPAEWGNEKANPNFKDQLQKADDEGIPFVVVLGEAELAKVSSGRLCLQTLLPPGLDAKVKGP